MKSYTDLKQSKKLTEILPLESADMWWLYITAQGKHIAMMHDEPDPHYIARMESYGIKNAAIRCWSLAALLDLIPSKIYDNNGNYAYLWVHKDIDEQQNKDNHYLAYYDPYDDFEHIETSKYDNFVDACYDMILKLNELKML